MLDLFRLLQYSILGCVIVKFCLKLLKGLKTFVLPRLIGEYNLTEKFGSWAGKSLFILISRQKKKKCLELFDK